MQEILINIIKVLYPIAVFQAFLMSGFLITRKKGNKISRIIFTILLLVFTIFMTSMFVLLSKELFQFHLFAHLANLSVFLASPLLYFYYLSLTNNKLKVEFRILLHTVPFLCIFSVMFYQIIMAHNQAFVFRPYGIILSLCLFFQNSYYLLLILRKRSSFFSSQAESKVKWFNYLLKAIMIIFILKLIAFIFWNILGLSGICIFFTGVIFIFSFIMINSVVIHSLYYPDVIINNAKYQLSTFESSEMENCYMRLLNILSEKKPYKNSLINLRKLARDLNISDKRLSQLINEFSGNNFNDFINQYRIKEAIEIIKADKKRRMTMLDVAYEAGFNSKSAFYSAFRKFTNMTPSEFMKNSEVTVNCMAE